MSYSCTEGIDCCHNLNGDIIFFGQNSPHRKFKQEFSPLKILTGKIFQQILESSGPMKRIESPLTDKERRARIIGSCRAVIVSLRQMLLFLANVLAHCVCVCVCVCVCQSVCVCVCVCVPLPHRTWPDVTRGSLPEAPRRLRRRWSSSGRGRCGSPSGRL